MRENVATRARRLLVEGRVRMVTVDHRRVEGSVRGDSSEMHAVTWRKSSGWLCTCTAATYGHTCAHVQAVMLVTIVKENR